MAWKEEYSVGNDLLDEQHQRLIEIVNRIEGDEPIGDLLTELERYATEHFREEERLIEAAGYPEIDKQKQQHNAFRAWLDRLRQQHQAGGDQAVARQDLHSYLRVWLANHLLVYDMAFKSWLESSDDPPTAQAPGDN